MIASSPGRVIERTPGRNSEDLGIALDEISKVCDERMQGFLPFEKRLIRRQPFANAIRHRSLSGCFHMQLPQHIGTQQPESRGLRVGGASGTTAITSGRSDPHQRTSEMPRHRW
jgi:hypothetical protein